MTVWTPVNRPTSDLIHARLDTHYASQIVAAVGATLVPPRPDASHTALTWDTEHQRLMGVRAGPAQLQAGLKIDGLELVLRTKQREGPTIPLLGRTLDESRRALEDAAAEHVDFEGGLSLPEHDLPDHGVGGGAPFGADGEALVELARWFANAAEVTERVRSAHDGASPVRVWPHHFDLATLIDYGAPEGGGEARSIGVGMSPGDGTYSEPYFYVTPWPYPDVSTKRGSLPAGHWHTEGFVAAILTATELTTHDAAARVSAFIDAALSHSKALLDLDASA